MTTTPTTTTGATTSPKAKLTRARVRATWPLMTWLRRLIWGATALLWVGLFTLTHMRIPLKPIVVSDDKTGHFLGYLALGFALFASLRVAGRRDPMLAVLIIGMAYGALDEQTQKLVGRTCDLNDWFADAAGIALAVTIATLITRWRDRRAERSTW
jgi:VanZ family protein